MRAALGVVIDIYRDVLNISTEPSNKSGKNRAHSQHCQKTVQVAAKSVACLSRGIHSDARPLLCRGVEGKLFVDSVKIKCVCVCVSLKFDTSCLRATEVVHHAVLDANNEFAIQPRQGFACVGSRHAAVV
eukprot:4246932-Amphidinium_carterae.2